MNVAQIFIRLWQFLRTDSYYQRVQKQYQQLLEQAESVYVGPSDDGVDDYILERD